MFPGLTEEAIHKYLQQSYATDKRHMKRQNQEVMPTKP